MTCAVASPALASATAGPPGSPTWAAHAWWTSDWRRSTRSPSWRTREDSRVSSWRRTSWATCECWNGAGVVFLSNFFLTALLLVALVVVVAAAAVAVAVATSASVVNFAVTKGNHVVSQKTYAFNLPFRHISHLPHQTTLFLFNPPSALAPSTTAPPLPPTWAAQGRGSAAGRTGSSWATSGTPQRDSGGACAQSSSSTTSSSELWYIGGVSLFRRQVAPKASMLIIDWKSPEKVFLQSMLNWP